MNKTTIVIIGILIGISGTMAISTEIGNIEKEIPITIIVDESIADANPNWKDDTRKLVTRSEELITGQKVRFSVVNQRTWQPALIGNESELSDFYIESSEKQIALEEELHSKKGGIVLIFTREMPKNVRETHDVRFADGASYLMIKYPDYLDEYQNDNKREKYYRSYGLFYVESELREIAIYAINS